MQQFDNSWIPGAAEVTVLGSYRSLIQLPPSTPGFRVYGSSTPPPQRSILHAHKRDLHTISPRTIARFALSLVADSGKVAMTSNGTGNNGDYSSVLSDGFSAAALFKQGFSYTYDDLIFHPGFIDFAVDDVDLATSLTRNIKLRTPCVSSPMDTVTEENMAVTMAAVGGIGFVHYNNTPQEQAQIVKRAKNQKVGYVANPVCVSPSDSISTIDSLKACRGFSSVVVTEDGELGSRLVGVVTSRDVDFVRDRSTQVREVMSRDVVTAPAGSSLEDAAKVLIQSKKSLLPLVTESGNFVALLCRTDLKAFYELPLLGAPSLGSDGKILVGAAIGTRDSDKDRLKLLVEAGVNVVIVDSSQGDSMYQRGMIEYIKKVYPGLDVIGGNVVTAYQAKNLIDAGVDGLRVGMGSGSICTTQEVCAVGRGQVCFLPPPQYLGFTVYGV